VLDQLFSGILCTLFEFRLGTGPELKRDLASKGGHAPRGSFQSGNPRVRGAGRKVGLWSSKNYPEE